MNNLILIIIMILAGGFGYFVITKFGSLVDEYRRKIKKRNE